LRFRTDSTLARALIVTLVVFTFFSVSSCRKSEKTGLEHGAVAKPGGVAPDFALPDLSGGKTSLSNYRGKVVLLEFWATWCPPCRATIPELVALQKRYGERNFSVLSVSLDEGTNLSRTLAKSAEELHINYPVLLGTEDVERSYGVRSIPVSFLIDKNGNIVDSFMGYVENFESVLSGRIEELL